uniref:CCHC-type domain-containing protein n=1 Tax=Setaria italica TaxID=4555 RepID=K3ZNG2_SETIT
MEGMEGLLKNLKLSEVEKKSIRIGGDKEGGLGDGSLKAFGKLLSDREVRSEVVEQTLGWIWCPRKGIECKDLGDNCFLLTFSQATAKRRALEEGPWMISNEALVIADFDGTKSLDEIIFSFIPIWIRVARLPMGLMNKATAEVIGDEFGKFLEVDFESDDLAAGRVLRVKVRLDIRLPLRRGITVDLGEGVGDRWCPVQYEFLPEFCYVCGIIGHVDKTCTKKLGKEERAPFDRALRFIPPKKRYGGGGWR